MYVSRGITGSVAAAVALSVTGMAWPWWVAWAVLAVAACAVAVRRPV